MALSFAKIEIPSPNTHNAGERLTERMLLFIAKKAEDQIDYPCAFS